MNEDFPQTARRAIHVSPMPDDRMARQAKTSRWRRLRLGLMLLACLGCGYVVGTGFSMKQAHKLELLKQKNAQRTVIVHRVRDENDALQEQLARAQVNIDIQEGMIHSLRSANEALQKRLGVVQRDLAFYQRLAMPQDGPGIQVQSFTVAQTAQEGLFQYRLILLSNHPNDDPHRGTLHLVLSGLGKSGQRLSMNLENLEPRHRKPVRFSFVSMADMTGQWLLPPGFQPETISVKVTEQGKKTIERRFRWGAALQ